jgi:ABC-type multidrug transport system fused ATPase/permease subunit
VIPDFHDEERLGKVYDADLVRRFWPFVAPYWPLVVSTLALIPLRAFFETLPARLFAIGLDDLSGSTPVGESAWLVDLALPPEGLGLLAWLAGLLFGVAVLSGLVALARQMVMAVVGQRALRDLRTRLFSYVQRLPFGFFDRYPIGRLVNRLTNDVETVSEIFTAGVVALIADLFVMAYVAYLLFGYHAKLALITMSLIPLLTIALALFRWKVREAFRLARVKIARMNAHLQETISGMKVVQLFARERRNLRDFAEINAEHREAWYRSIGYDSLLFSTVDLAGNLTIALILWYGAGLVGHGEVGLGLLFIFVDYMRRFLQPLRDLSARYAVMQSSMAGLERIFQLLDTPEETPEAERPRELPAGGEVVFDGVSFAYGEEEVLHDVSFRVAPGERVALVGPTGAGKTTILKLLARLYDVDKGAIRINGVDIRELPRTELRRHLAFVLQDVFLFTGDLRYNISLGRGDISEDEIRRAAEVVHADRLVRRLPDGFGQYVHERGVNFSAGERQLLSFARALAQRPEILLLDEATSNVDTETEALVQDGLRRLMEGKTAIVVAHRLSTIQDVDRIYVLQKGSIREQGTHDELLARRELYWRLYQLQYVTQARTAA